jgi:hypothetical protein
MIHFDVKHQKSEVKAKIKRKNLSETKIKRKKVKKAKKQKKRKNRLEFRFALFRIETKITKVKRSKKFEAKISKRSEENFFKRNRRTLDHTLARYS